MPYDRKKRNWSDIIMGFVGVCAGFAILAWTAGAVVIVIMMIKQMP